MSQNKVRSVNSNQEGLYKDLEKTVRKYATTKYLRPIANHTLEAFTEVQKFIHNFYSSNPNKPLKIILDSGCGTGESTIHLAKRFPHFPVIGVDKSAMRLTKTSKLICDGKSLDIPSNAFWVRAELLDFWRLTQNEIDNSNWEIIFHTIYYPNPWPKQSEATRRFHLHPIFPTLVNLGNKIELRTNWDIYAKEFASAAKILSSKNVQCNSFFPESPETAFERKYKESKQQLWQVLVF